MIQNDDSIERSLKLKQYFVAMYNAINAYMINVCIQLSEINLKMNPGL